MLRLCLILVGLVATPDIALAHASEQGFVLLLPTDIYIAAGVASVALTLVLIAALPDAVTAALFRPVPMLRRLPQPRLRHSTSCASALLLGFLVWRGFTGPRDPLTNPMPLFIWAVWWIGLVSLQGLFGNIWRWINPWTGPTAVLSRLTGAKAPLRYPRGLGHAPGIAVFLGFAAFLLADPAPADPTRLASFVGLYWYATLLGLVLFGPAWMVRVEAVTILMRCYGKMGLLARHGRALSFGLWGFKALRNVPPLSLALFMLILLGTGSFDGLNETFWWLGVLDINPLEFPGRSVVITQNLIGLLISNAALIGIFAICLWLGERLSSGKRSLRELVCLLAPSILPIALGYHIAHYLASALVEGQYVLKALNDPMSNGADLLGLGTFYVTTGFFNTPGTVKLIWLSQAGAVVIGHVVAILMAHAIAIQAGMARRQAILGQIPLALFMIAYTFFGLWLLASPRGL